MSRTVVVIGGVAGGMSAAARLRRLDQQADVIVLEAGGEVSFAACGLPYYLDGEIPERDGLLLHTPQTLARTLRLDVRTHTQALAVDATRKVVTARTAGAAPVELHYDAVVLATGATALRPPIPGLDSPRVHTLRTLPDADQIRTRLATGARRAVILGAGFIGLEAAEALCHAGLDVDVVEAAPHVLPVVDREVAWHVRQELTRHGVRVHEGTAAVGVRDTGDGAAVRLADGTELVADIVVLSVGIRPRSELARDAGLDLSPRGAVLVDAEQRTSDPHIWAVGDVTAYRDHPTGDPVPLGGPANRAGRAAADSILGRPRRSPLPLATAVVRVFDLTVAMTGASRRGLAGRPFHTARTHAGHHAGYFPGAEPMHLLLHFGADGRILGAQGVGRAGVDKRIDVIATAIRGGLRADDLLDLDLAYAPPYGSAKDPVQILGMIADNVLTGRAHQADPAEPAPSPGLVLDVRSPAEYAAGHHPGAVNLPQPDVQAGLDRIRRLAAGRPVLVYCAGGYRSYLAHRQLQAAGIDSRTLSGGWSSWQAAQPASTGSRTHLRSAVPA